MSAPASPPIERTQVILLRQRATIGQHAGVAGDEYKYFAGVAEAVIAKRQPGQRVVGNVIEEYKPQRQAPARIQPQVTAVAIDMNGRSQIRSHDL